MRTVFIILAHWLAWAGYIACVAGLFANLFRERSYVFPQTDVFDHMLYIDSGPAQRHVWRAASAFKF
jgi:hypothetical protein